MVIDEASNFDIANFYKYTDKYLTCIKKRISKHLLPDLNFNSVSPGQPTLTFLRNPSWNLLYLYRNTQFYKSLSNFIKLSITFI